VINEIENVKIEHVLIDVESTPIFESLDISSSTNRPEFPSEEFGDFMKLLVKWNLSDACGSDILKFSRKICRDNVILPTSTKQERQLIDQINVSHVSFKKTLIMLYNNEVYYLYHRHIFDAIKELLGNPNIFKHCIFEFKILNDKYQRVYHEQYNRKW